MEEYFSLLKKMPLFHNATDEDITYVLRCLEAFTKSYDKNEVIYNYFERIPYAGIVLSGEIHVVMHNSTGSEYSIRRFIAGDIFGESYACIPEALSTIQVLSHQKCMVLFMRFSNLFLPYASTCPHASKITANLLKETARNNIFQNQKIQILTQRHVRDKLTTYLYTLSQDDTRTVRIPFDRQGLANYLGVERSALSRELSRMQKEGLLDFYKNRITLLQ